MVITELLVFRPFIFGTNEPYEHRIEGFPVQSFAEVADAVAELNCIREWANVEPMQDSENKNKRMLLIVVFL